MTNEELFKLYDNDLVLRLHNVKNLSDTRKILARFKEYLNCYPPSPELANSENCSPRVASSSLKRKGGFTMVETGKSYYESLYEVMASVTSARDPEDILLAIVEKVTQYIASKRAD